MSGYRKIEEVLLLFRIKWKEDLGLYEKVNSQGNSVKRTIPTALFRKAAGHSFSCGPITLCLFS